MSEHTGARREDAEREDPEQPTFERPPQEIETQSMSGCLTRLGWLVVAPIAIVFLGATMLKNGTGALALESIVYWVVVAGAVGLRYYDVFRLEGETVAGQPASHEHWWRYAIGLPSLALALWCAAVWFG